MSAVFIDGMFPAVLRNCECSCTRALIIIMIIIISTMYTGLLVQDRDLVISQGPVCARFSHIKISSF